MLPVSHPLVAILHQVQAGLQDPANHYLVNTNYFETENGPVLLGTLYIHQQAVEDLVIGPDGFSCQVFLTPPERQLVKAAYQQIWQVLQGDSPQFDLDEDESVILLYEDTDALAPFAQEGPTQ